MKCKNFKSKRCGENIRKHVVFKKLRQKLCNCFEGKNAIVIILNLNEKWLSIVMKLPFIGR